ncbi:MAG TPA: CarD family transcriptional regulator, partial [Chroococcales cyanobacterium]
QQTNLSIAVGESVDQHKLAEELVRLGYSRESVVTLRGEFSIRGDIIDIFPSSGMPCRIELFSDEVESIRVFNIENQRSVEEVNKVQVPPRWWVILDTNEKESFESFLNRIREVTEKRVAELQPTDPSAAETLQAVMEGDLTAFEGGGYPESAEYYAPYLHDRFTTLLDYLPENALLLFDEWDSLALSLASYEEKLNRSFEEGLVTGRLLPLPRPLNLSVEQLGQQLKARQRVYLSSLPVFGEDSEEARTATVHFECLPVERFGNQMQVLIDRIKQWRKEGFKVLVSTEQPQRILGLLKEWDCPASYLTAHQETHIGGENQEGQGNGAEPQKQATLNEILSLPGMGRPPDADVWVTRAGFLGGFKLDDVQLISVTDAEMFGLKRKPTTYRRPVAEKTYDRFTSVTDLKVGDYVVHIKQGIGQFTGVQRIAVDGEKREYVTVQYSGDDRLYVPVDQINLLSRYRGAGETAPRLSRLGGAEWESTKRRVKKSVKAVAEDLVNLYALRAKQEGFACLPDTPWQYEMEEAFPFDETPDQWQAISDTKKDLESSKPMDRLICGDVGFGKTEVAIRSIFKTVMSGKQAAVLVPTTILAQQHFNTLSD